MTEDETVWWHHQLNGHEQALGDGEGQGSLVSCSPWVAKSQTRRSDWTELNICRAICQCCCCSVTKLCLTLCDPTDCRIPGFPALHHLPELAQAHVHWVWWCHPTILSSVIPFFSCLQSFPASGSFLMNRLFASGGQSIRASASVLPRSIQGWFPLGLTGLISLQSKGL